MQPEQRRKYFKEHLQLGDYYSQENIVSGEWTGIGAEMLGLTGRVKQDQFLKLCHNQNPQTGELLTQRMKTTRWDSDKMAEVANRQVFYDFTFSLPKSVSIQALIADDKRLLKSHSWAVRIAVNELQHFAGTRIHKGLNTSESSPAMIDKTDSTVTAHERLDLTDAQKRDQRFYPANAVIVFNRETKDFAKCEVGTLLKATPTHLLIQTESKIQRVPFKLLNRLTVCQPVEMTLAKGDQLQLKANAPSLDGKESINGELVTVKTTNEIHLFPYGYYQHAKFVRQSGKDVVQIQFQDQIVVVKGKGLEPLCDALEQLAVEQIKVRPEKYEGLGKNERTIEEIEVKQSGEI